ncbi:MAG TPA: hypothetical protein PLG49_04595 [Defluviitaleaceae bacterium]|nr:hypothetical protein [Defluviitaleaceae bacterium]
MCSDCDMSDMADMYQYQTIQLLGGVFVCQINKKVSMDLIP